MTARRSKPVESHESGLHPIPRSADPMSMFAHDIKSPLAALAMNLEFVASELADSPELELVNAAIDDSRVAVRRTFRMIADMVAVSRFHDGALRPELASTDIAALVDRALSATASEATSRGVRLLVKGHAAPIDADAGLLGSALENVIEWVLRFASDGAELTVQIEDGASLHIDVACTGVALPAVLPLEGDAQGKTCLALTFCRAALTAHRGGIRIAGTPRAVRLELPR